MITKTTRNNIKISSASFSTQFFGGQDDTIYINAVPSASMSWLSVNKDNVDDLIQLLGEISTYFKERE